MSVGDFICSHDPRTHWRECIATLGSKPLPVSFLHVPCAHIVGEGVAGDILMRLLRRNFVPSAANDNSEFSFVIHLLGYRGQPDRTSRITNRTVRFRKENGIGGSSVAGFAGMFAVIASNTNNLRWLQNGSAQSRGIQSQE